MPGGHDCSAGLQAAAQGTAMAVVPVSAQL